jgi:hypothetical protein
MQKSPTPTQPLRYAKEGMQKMRYAKMGYFYGKKIGIQKNEVCRKAQPQPNP